MKAFTSVFTRPCGRADEVAMGSKFETQHCRARLGNNSIHNTFFRLVPSDVKMM